MSRKTSQNLQRGHQVMIMPQELFVLLIFSKLAYEQETKKKMKVESINSFCVQLKDCQLLCSYIMRLDYKTGINENRRCYALICIFPHYNTVEKIKLIEKVMQLVPSVYLYVQDKHI